MARFGNHIFLWIIATFAITAWLQPPSWTVFIAALAIGWYYNDKEVKRDV
ncbi:hypothetical protein [Erythrobacter sp. EC-HK427]|nr:hypothetical protein [Erythrobacter sp. EC-HK427]VVT06975.1 hypothetical protein ERY430_41437 [Erythrobacter sp. EC-HK427]